MRYPAQPFKRTLAALALIGLAMPAMAETSVTDAWVRATVAHQQSTGAFMVLTASTDSKLVDVQSPVAEIVQVHEMTMHNDVMGMKQVHSVHLPAGKAVSLDPNGYHVMLIKLKQQIKEGEQVPLTLVVEDAKGQKQTLQIQAPVRALNAEAMHGGHDHMH
ncbi:copper chaperone PCu(A)C [Pseudomonas arcuscaelestis]